MCIYNNIINQNVSHETEKMKIKHKQVITVSAATDMNNFKLFTLVMIRGIEEVHYS